MGSQRVRHDWATKHSAAQVCFSAVSIRRPVCFLTILLIWHQPCPGPCGNWLQGPWAAGQCRIFCLDFAVGRGQFHLSALVDQEVEGCLLCPRVLTNKPKFERCALTPQGKGSKVFWQGRQSSSPRGAGESPSLTSKTWISSHLTLPLFFPLSEHLLSYWLQIYHMFSL